MRVRLLVLVAAVAALPAVASADPNDIVLSRLTYGFDGRDFDPDLEPEDSAPS